MCDLNDVFEYKWETRLGKKMVISPNYVTIKLYGIQKMQFIVYTIICI